MFFLGIDPGLSEVGFGIVELKDREPVFVDCGIIKTKAGAPFGERLTTIKNDLKDIKQSFERYQYNVLAVLHQSEYENQLQERYDSLMRYLEV